MATLELQGHDLDGTAPTPSTFAMPIMGKSGRLGVYTFGVTAAHRDRAEANHKQSLERLRSRGGLCWTELYCILQNKRLWDVSRTEAAQERVRAYYVDELKGDWTPA